MNIFYLDESPVKSASYLCDKHVNKMLIESVQMLSTAHRILDKNLEFEKDEKLYKATHANHPCNVWVRQNTGNYFWLFHHALELHNQYRLRYGKHKTHKSSLLFPYLFDYPKNMKHGTFEIPPKCMPDEYKVGSCIQSYRNYYIGDKLQFSEWKNVQKPYWIPEKIFA